MKELRLLQAAQAVNGRLDGADGVFSGVYIDSRKPVSGGLFIAIEGERFDGHDFVKNAEADGAAAVLCRKPVECALPVIYVDDTKNALLALASYYRGLFSCPVVGLTGSVGKTTTKEMTALVLSAAYKTVKTQGNLNNDIGMPQTIFTMDDSTEAAVIEMGMNHKGEIARLAAVSRPDIGIITNIGVSHIENLGSRENILQAKLEMLTGMKKGSPLILNGDNDLLSTVRNRDFDIRFFGIENPDCAVRAVDLETSADGTACKIVWQNQKYPTFIPAAGIHNVYDALAAFAAGTAAGVAPEKAADALRQYVPAGMRQKTVRKNGITFIEDCYNASPDSVKAGLNALADIPAKRRIAVLGDMLELGDYAETAHAECGKYAAQKKIDILITVGEESRYTAKAAEEAGLCEVHHEDNTDDAAKRLLSMLQEGDAALFKASRGMKFENILHIIYNGLEV